MEVGYLWKEEEGEEKKGRKNLNCSAGHEWFHQDHRCPGAEGTCWRHPRPRRDGEVSACSLCPVGGGGQPVAGAALA